MWSSKAGVEKKANIELRKVIGGWFFCYGELYKLYIFVCSSLTLYFTLKENVIKRIMCLNFERFITLKDTWPLIPLRTPTSLQTHLTHHFQIFRAVVEAHSYSSLSWAFMAALMPCISSKLSPFMVTVTLGKRQKSHFERSGG